MDRGDGRLDLVLADAPAGDRVVEEREPFGDGNRVPAGPILVGQRDQGAIGRRSGRAAGIDQEHQGEQPGDLGVIGQQAPRHPRQADRLVRQLGSMELCSTTAGIALVEDEVQDPQHEP